MADVSKYVPSPEMRESLAEMRSLAEAAKREESLNPSTVKSIPKSLNPALTTFACLLKRESAAHPSARDQNLYQVALYCTLRMPVLPVKLSFQESCEGCIITCLKILGSQAI